MRTTIKNLKTIGKDYLKKKKIESLEAESSASYFLIHILRLESKGELFLKEKESLGTLKRKKYFHFLRRRAKREPVQYITGTAPFLDLNFEVNKDVLIPRPETEILVNLIIEKGMKRNSKLSILDIGTGSGNIACSLAYYLPQANLTAVDISDTSLSLAEKNAQKNNVSSKIRFKKSSLFDSIDEKFDFLVANLPYLNEKEIDEVASELVFEPKRALVAGKRGTELIEKLIEDAPKYLHDNGELFLEIGNTQGKEVASLLKQNGFSMVEIIKDYAGHDRIVSGVKVDG